MTSKDIIRTLERAGWKISRMSGSHHVLTAPDGRITVVPHPRKDLGKGLVRAIEKQTGVKMR